MIIVERNGFFIQECDLPILNVTESDSQIKPKPCLFTDIRYSTRDESAQSSTD